MSAPTLPRPLPYYDQSAEGTRNQILEQALRQALYRGQDYEVGRARVILTAPDGSRWALQVDNTGALSTTAA